jgi:phage shock protein PspC (stress-responsive transcriptional regulator)
MIKSVTKMIDKKVDDNKTLKVARDSNANRRQNSEEYQNWNHPSASQQPYYSYPPKKLYRSTRNKWLGGVCGGIAEYFNADPVLVRILWVVVTIFSVGIGVIAYLLFWLFVDKNPGYYHMTTEYVTRDNRGIKHHHYYYKMTQ